MVSPDTHRHTQTHTDTHRHTQTKTQRHRDIRTYTCEVSDEKEEDNSRCNDANEAHRLKPCAFSHCQVESSVCLWPCEQCEQCEGMRVRGVYDRVGTREIKSIPRARQETADTKDQPFRGEGLLICFTWVSQSIQRGRGQDHQLTHLAYPLTHALETSIPLSNSSSFSRGGLTKREEDIWTIVSSR